MNDFFQQYQKTLTCLLACAFILALPLTVQAAKPVEKIYIKADHMQMNIISGKSTYTGNVRISQGDLVLTGDKVTLERKKEAFERIIVFGKPAHYNHVTDTGDTIQAQSEHMVYTASQNKLVMTINAHLLQPDLKLSSQKIIYDTQKKIVIAGGNDNAATNGDRSIPPRVNITLTPKEADTDL